MNKIIPTTLVCFFCCFGCTFEPKNPPVWESAKFSDLAKTKTSDKTDDIPLQFTLYIFSAPADNFELLKDLWSASSAKSLRVADEKLFFENGFAAYFGHIEAWQPIAKKLRSAGVKSLNTVDLIIFDNTPQNVPLIRFEKEKDIFYLTAGSKINGATIGQGSVMLKISATTIADTRGVCNITVEPFFQDDADKKNAQDRTEGLFFDSVSFSVKMSPRDFFLIGPAIYARSGMTPGSIFFFPPDSTTVQFYLIACTGVNN